jgi:hypothetical protein
MEGVSGGRPIVVGVIVDVGGIGIVGLEVIDAFRSWGGILCRSNIIL